MKKIFIILVFIGLLVVGRWSWVFAESCSTSCSDDSLDKCMAECQKLINLSVNATKPHEQTATALEKDIADIEGNIKTLTILLDKKKAIIDADNLKFAAQQQLLDSQVRDFYKKNWTSPAEYFLATVFSAEGVGETINNLAYRQNLIDQQKRLITSLVLKLADLNNQKKQLEDNQGWLAAKQDSLEATLAPIRDLVNRAKAYQSQLTQTLGSLSSRQQALIAARIGSLNLSRSAGISMACADDRKIDPGFGTGFAFYTFGIPHRVGLNQFGAKGRANDGKTAEEILRAYFQNFDFSTGFDNRNVRVNGTNEYGQTFDNKDMNIEDYLNHLYEMPAGWPAAALQAQAIAARSYALAVMKDSGYLRPSQADQVIKTEENSQAWKDAVTATKGRVMTQGGEPIKAWFSSTDGGYTLTSGEAWTTDKSWTKHTRDTSGDINNISDLFSKAYDRDSPCFYNAQGWRTGGYNKSAWLRPEEVADIANVVLLVKKKPETACFLFQPDKPPPSPDKDCPQTGNWSPDKVRQELGSEALSTATSVEISGFDLGAGRTTQVKINGVPFDGSDFKNYFNLRAPANIAIVGPLFNVEKR